MTFLTIGACAGRERIPVRMLLITSQIVNAFNMNVIYAKPYSRTTYANNVNISKFDTGTTSILNIAYASYSRSNVTPEKALRKQRKKIRRAHVRLWRIQLICIFYAEIDRSAT